jgi:phosphatidylglycerophosphate synthase
MSKPNYVTAISDAMFVLLPFVVLLIVKIMQGKISTIIMIPDYSLAISIMYGQLLSKTLHVKEKNKKNENFQLFQVIIFMVSIISIVFYIGFQLIDDVSNLIYIVQFLLFLIAMVIYIPILSLINKINDGK